GRRPRHHGQEGVVAEGQVSRGDGAAGAGERQHAQVGPVVDGQGGGGVGPADDDAGAQQQGVDGLRRRRLAGAQLDVAGRPGEGQAGHVGGGRQRDDGETGGGADERG